MAEDKKERPVLTLENEIVNYFSHLAEEKENPAGVLKTIPGLVKRMLKEVEELDSLRGTIYFLEKTNANREDIPQLKVSLEEKEAALIKRYRKEEIKGT